MNKIFLSLLLVFTITSCASLIEPLLKPSVNTELTSLRSGEYRIDPSHAKILFKVGHLGLSTYVGRFNEFDAELNFDPKNIEQSTLEAVIKIASIDCNDQTLEDTLKEPSWFDAARFPEALFRSSNAYKLANGDIEFEGMFTLRGKTMPLVVRGKFHGGANNILTGKYTLGFSGSTTIKRSDYKIDNYLSLVADDVAIEIYAEFLRR